MIANKGALSNPQHISSKGNILENKGDHVSWSDLASAHNGKAVRARVHDLYGMPTCNGKGKATYTHNRCYKTPSAHAGDSKTVHVVHTYNSNFNVVYAQVRNEEATRAYDNYCNSMRVWDGTINVIRACDSCYVATHSCNIEGNVVRTLHACDRNYIQACTQAGDTKAVHAPSDNDCCTKHATHNIPTNLSNWSTYALGPLFEQDEASFICEGMYVIMSRFF